MANPPTGTGNGRLRRKPTAKEPPSPSISGASSARPQKPPPNYLKPTMSFRHDAQLPKKPTTVPRAATMAGGALDRRRSFNPKPVSGASRQKPALYSSAPKTTRSPDISARRAAPSKPVITTKPPARRSKPDRGSPPSRKQRMKGGKDGGNEGAATGVAVATPPASGSGSGSPPDWMDDGSMIESEQEEAEGLMRYAIDEELDEIERGWMSPSEISTAEICTDASSSEGADVKINGGDADALEGRGGEGGTEKIVTCEGEGWGDTGRSTVQKQRGWEDDGEKAAGEAEGGYGMISQKASPPYNNATEETASRILEKRKQKVRALVGAFETIISLQDPDPVAHPNPESEALRIPEPEPEPEPEESRPAN